MALATNALTLVDTVNAELGVSTGADTARDTRVERYINVGSDLFEQLCSRKFYYAEAHTEKVKGSGRKRLVVKDHLPIDSIDSIVYDDGDSTDTEDADDYRIENADKGFIQHVSHWLDTRTLHTEISTHRRSNTGGYYWEVTYDGGWVTPKQEDDGTYSPRTLPYNIEDAVVQYAIMREAQQGSDPSVGKISMDDGSITYIEGANGGRIQVPMAFRSAVSKYAYRVV